MKSKLSVLSVVLLPIFFCTTIAGDRTNIRGVGMGRTMNATSRGTDAIGINPANLAIPDIGRVTLNLLPIGFRISTELFNYDIYQEYFTGVDSAGKRWAKHLETADKEKILSQLPDLPQTRIELESMILGLSFQHSVVGGIGFAVTEHIGATFSFSKDYFKMFAFGLEPKGSVYTFDGTGIEAWWYREYNLSYGRKLPVKIKFLKDIYAGVGIKFIRGYGIFQTMSQKSSFGNYPDSGGSLQYSLKGNVDFLTAHAGADFFNENSNASFTFMPDPVGKGTGFDIGLSAEVISGLRVGASVTDIGKITWDQNVIESVGGGGIDLKGVFGQLQDTLKNAVKGKTRPGTAFDTDLPTAFRLGVMMEAYKLPFLKFLPGRFLLAVDYLQGFNESLGNTTKPRLSFGAEYRIIPLIPLRSGLAFGGGDKVRWAFGFGLDFRYLSLDFATDNFGMFFSPKNFQMFSISLGLKIRV
jgi:hypothetical protein